MNLAATNTRISMRENPAPGLSGSSIAGCSRCKKRRIRCDRREPSCYKCSSKGLKCPGYGFQLRWAGGAAIRGGLVGLQTHAEGQLRQVHPNYFENMKELDVQSFAGHSPKQLIDYYSEHIAPCMVWFDSTDNIYRRHILPLAQKNKVVRLAVVSVAAQHFARSRGDGAVSEDARNEAVNAITAYINGIRNQLVDEQHADVGIDINAAEWILATMLVLSFYEMAHSGADAAEFHRKAARSLIATISTTRHRKSKLFTFMRNKLSIYEVLACTVSFDEQNIRDAVVPDPADELGDCNETTLFSGYLKLIHDITIVGRCRQGDPAERGNRDWKGDFEIAQGVTLMAIGRNAVSDTAQHRDLVRLVNIHHNAALLYASCCLEYKIDDEIRSNLLRLVQSMDDVDRWLHNLPWPLFIAGVKSRASRESQLVISQLYRSISEVTRLRHYLDVLTFLEVFWSGNEPDWQVLAKDWELSGRKVLAY